MKISGTERVLPKEKIILNISLLKEGIAMLRLSLSKSLVLKIAYNYELEKWLPHKKDFNFDVSRFNFEDNLALAFISEKLKNSDENASIKIEALDIESNVKEMSIFDIEILKPLIHVGLRPGDEPGELKIKVEKKERLIAAKFQNFEFSAEELTTSESVRVSVERYTLEEFIENIDNIPAIIDMNSAFKRIIIDSHEPILLYMKVLYSDALGNIYKSNKAQIKLYPVLDEEATLPEREIIANPIFQTIGFEAPLATA